MLFSFFRHCILVISTLFILSLISYSILLKDPLNQVLATPHFFSGYFFYLQNLLQGDFGITYHGGESLKELIFAVLPPTLELCVSAMLLALIFGIPLGLLSALYADHLCGKAIRSFYITGIAIPVFWLAPILLYFSAIQNWEISAIGQYNLLYEIKPITGFPIIDVWFTDQPYRIKMIQNVLQHLVLPTLVLAILPTMDIIRIVQQRADFLFTQSYVKIAETRGWSKRKILQIYILRNTIPIMIPQMSRLFTLVMAQCMLIESTFGWFGIGHWLIDAVRQQDYNSISIGIIVVGFCIIAVNLFTEFLSFILDPFNKKNWYAR
ncbi:ABC transporter permease [Histophilus somni]|uniref:Peptide ABC transporter, permease n=1 Tax=Histophilus somni (strain 129Pt) TaxID=205914 RepID=Q0I340_HISS1|nr:ABC transporter permease subunit [Histophilus somni]ACA32626.1 binding-protein-dependent transport systems inner membrane component [Histophilus somni 2336]QQF86889.1 ABC transporter permease subunit [Histophilus somni]QQJ89316.1 ABC transporter permease subunit [Histophilus somni]